VLSLRAGSVETTRLLQLRDRSLAAVRPTDFRVVRIGGRQYARQDNVRRGIARMLADRLLAQRLHLIGDGEPMLAIALLWDRAKELLSALDETGARGCRRADAREQKRADDEAPELHAPQYTPSIDLTPRRAV
jgi:hypothetical protein